MSDPNQLITQAMAVLEEAHAVADALRADADRYSRDRRSEADLLLGKARRVLLAAETKADAMLAAARGADPSPSSSSEPVPGEPVTVIDLDEPADEEAMAEAGDDGERTSLDRLLDAAIARAVTQALPREPAS